MFLYIFVEICFPNIEFARNREREREEEGKGKERDYTKCVCIVIKSPFFEKPLFADCFKKSLSKERKMFFFFEGKQRIGA